MKYLIFLPFAIMLFTLRFANAQPTMKGVLIANFDKLKTNDEINLIAYKQPNANEDGQYLYKQNGELKYIPQNKIKLLNTNIDQWDQVWFINRSYDAVKDNWDLELRSQLKSDYNAYMNDIYQYNLTFEDDLLYDYFSQLINKICPHPIFKGKNYYLKVLVIKANEKEIYSFDNGMIILTTGLLSEIESEKDLVYIISKEIANIVLDFNLINLKQQIKADKNIRFWTGLVNISSHVVAEISQNKNMNSNKIGFTHDDAELLTLSSFLVSSSIMEKMGVKLAEEQLKLADFNAQTYINNKFKGWNTRSNEDFSRIISNVISYSAWQNYFQAEFSEVNKKLNRLENYKLLSEDDFLLKSKMIRNLYSTEESVYEALDYLKASEKLGLTELVDIYKEYGILYLRINKKQDAILNFEKYREALLRIHENGQNANKELIWVNNLLFRYRN